MDNFTAIRNGLLDHARAWKLSPFDFGIYVFLIMRADYSTGIYVGCALAIACQFGDPSQKEHVQKSLRRLRDKKYINYRNGDGSRGAYPILINKFFVTVGELSGCRLNAWKHNGVAQPEYERWNGGGTVETVSWHGGGTVVAPNKDLRPKTEDVEDKSESAGALPRAETKRALQMREDFAPKDGHKQLASELGVDLASEFEVFKDHHLGHGSKFVDWDRALNKWLRNAREFRRTKGNGHGNGNGKPSVGEIVEREVAILRARRAQ
jgi:hypothetical protein